MTTSNDTITVGIAGLTGKFARLIASCLLQQPNVAIRGYVRDPTKLPSWLVESDAVHIIRGGAFDTSAARVFAKGCDVIICGYLGNNEFMIEGQKVLIDACSMEGVPRYIASDYCLNFTKLEKGQLFPKDPMIEVKKYLESKDVKGVHVLIGAFMDTLFSAYFQIWDGREKSLTFWGNEDSIWESTTYKNAAGFVAAVAVDRTAVGVKKFLGDRRSMREIADLFQSAYGFRPQLKRLGSLDDVFKHMHELKTKYPEEPMRYMAMFYQYYCINGQCYLGEFANLDNSTYSQVKPEGFKEFFARTPVETLGEAMANAGNVSG
ncbi:hypothetical protein B0J11DRAFT_581878 [Dendryphion nanum]|uniref:NmrA-like domain-containing protein n=1 Tax=Dendryphion nanum TaxID=256645 RepID=A0A9P9DKY6_9PLEO|nr:hypothetical protein B0J11DRAFT_581878 [Dendryphion nanum]